MLYHLSQLKHCKLGAIDGEIGHVKDIYFDDENWAVRYLLADTGGWLSSHQVLISPYALGAVEWDNKLVDVNLSKQKIEKCPPIESHEPVSRQYERNYHAYYGWPLYWSGSSLWGDAALPIGIEAVPPMPMPAEISEPTEPHLRSATEMEGYEISATDKTFGHVVDFLIEESSWAVRYLVLDVNRFWPGKKLLIAVQWVSAVSWEGQKISVDLPYHAIESAKAYSGTPPTRQEEAELFEHYSQEAYWKNDFIAEGK